MALYEIINGAFHILNPLLFIPTFLIIYISLFLYFKFNFLIFVFNDYIVVYLRDISDRKYAKPQDIESFDYVVHLAEWTSGKSFVERSLGLKLNLTYDVDGLVHVYKIIHE